MTHKVSFDIKTPDDFFHMVVIPQHDDFLANKSSSRHALLAIIVAFHMYEWANRRPFTPKHFQSKYPQNLALAEVFDLAKKITDGTKHFRRKKVKTRTQPGFNSGFDDGFERRKLMVGFPDGSEKSANWFLREMVDFWRKQEKDGAF
jgi:hypothetical protein